MDHKSKTRLGWIAGTAALVLALAFVAGSAQAATQYLNDGAKQNVNGKWDLPTQGQCYSGVGTPVPLTGTGSISNKAVCTATITGTNAGVCAATGQLGASWKANGSQNVCLDVLANQSQLACISSGNVDRVWSGGVCLLSMKGYDRNKVTCNVLGGTYGALGTLVPSYATSGACIGAWVMPDGGTFTPALLTSTQANGNPGPGDQCLRCHRSDTEWNTNRVRDVESMLMTGHKNMSRKADTSHGAGLDYPWAGANGVTYPKDGSGNTFDFANGKITVGGLAQDLNWIYGGWFESPYLPSAIYKPASGQLSYSCGRCHTTGWTSDTALSPTTGNLAKEPEKSFPGISYHATLQSSGWVKLGGGVSGDGNTLASWDLFGITCTRCHGSLVNNSGSLPYPAPSGYDTHNNGLTAYSSGSGNTDTGYCSVPGPALGYGVSDPTNAKAACTVAGGTWLTTACSDGVSTTQIACLNAGKTWTYPSCSTNGVTSTVGTVGGVPQAYCSTPVTAYNQTQCTAVGGTWTTSCSVTPASGNCANAAPGSAWNSTALLCFVPNATYTTASACAALAFNADGTPNATKTGTISPTWTNAYASDVDSCKDAGGKWTDNKTQRGQIITATCMGCHRQETGGLPYGATNVTATYGTQAACTAAGKTWTGEAGANGVLSTAMCIDYSATDPGQSFQVGLNHGAPGFLGHWHANSYLNSPHAKFTSTFDKIATGKFSYAGTGEYKSFFLTDGEAANTGNGCTGCHNVHKSTYSVANPAGGAVKECTECHQKSLSTMRHPSGVGTPLANPAEACVTCHMPGGQHFFRINTDPTYATIPTSVYSTGANATAATSADGTYSKAIWVDLNAACGQCHGGGTANTTTASPTTAASAALTVADATGFAVGENVTVKGAGASGADLVTYVKAVTGTAVTLGATASTTLPSAVVILNPPSSGAAYFTKAQIATYAKGIHNDAPAAAFDVLRSGLTVSVDASRSTCSGSNANCNAFSWNFGDGATASGVTASHTYANPATSASYTITLTVDQYGVGTSTSTYALTVSHISAPPAAAGSCTFDGTTWIATCNSTTTTPDAGYQQVIVNWGDGTVLTNVMAAPWTGPFTHTYLMPGGYTINLIVIDTVGQQNRASIGQTLASAFVYQSVGGKVFKAGGVLPIGGAQILVKKAGVLVKTLMTLADGSYSVGTIKPGTYTLTVSKPGYTFATPTVTITLPGTASPVNFTAN